MCKIYQAGIETLQIENCVRGHHIYERIWNPTVGEELNCVRETTNSEDPYAVMRNIAVVDHVPCKMRAYALRELCVGALRITSCFEIKFGGCFVIRQTAKLKSSPNFPTEG